MRRYHEAVEVTAVDDDGHVQLPTVYSLEKMPRVNTHTHIGEMEPMDDFLRVMDASKLTIAIDLSGRALVDQIDEIHERYKGRILLAPGSYRTGDELWWSMEDLGRFAKIGCAGLKIHCYWVRGIPSEENIAKIRHQGKLGLPVLGFHIADPPEGRFLKPGRDECIADAIKVIGACPGTTLIMAHGFWLMNNDKYLDRLAGHLDRYPNIYLDISACFQWWDRPDPTPEKLRAFVLKYQDRLMYGTDGGPRYNTKAHAEDSYRVLETSDECEHGFFEGNQQPIKGLALPLEALNRIYWWNAARTIPRVREVLRDMGYDV